MSAVVIFLAFFLFLQPSISLPNEFNFNHNVQESLDSTSSSKEIYKRNRSLRSIKVPVQGFENNETSHSPDHQGMRWEQSRTRNVDGSNRRDGRELKRKTKREPDVQKKKQFQTYNTGVPDYRKHLVRSQRSLSLPSVHSICTISSPSCRSRCAQKSIQVTHKEELFCYCDIYCEFFKDCCADFDDFCEVSGSSIVAKNIKNPLMPSPNLGNRQSRIVAPFEKALWKCFNTTARLKRTEGIWMIGSCPTSWPQDTVFYKCRNLSVNKQITLDNYHYLPVYSKSEIVYHNQFCAQCNGEHIKELKSYHLSLKCDLTPPDHLNSREKLEFLFAYCSGVTWKPLEGQPRRYCLEIRSNCSSKNNPALKGQCNSTKVRLVNDNRCIYKNIKCAQCNGRNKSTIKCGPDETIMNDTCKQTEVGTEGSPLPKPFSFILDFNSLGSMAVKCESGKIFDRHFGTCRKTLSLPKYSEIDEYRIALWIQSAADDLDEIDKRFRLSASLIIGDIARTLGVFPKQLSNLTIDPDKSPIKIEMNLQGTFLKDSGPLENILNFTSPFNMTIFNVKFIVVKATKRALRCSNMQVYQEHEYTSADNRSAVYIKNTGEVLRFIDYYVIENSANQSRDIFVCRKTPICSGMWVFIEEHEFTVLTNSFVFVNASKRIYGTSEQLWKNRSLYVCKNFSRKNSKHDYVMSILTLACMSISITALVFVLVTYSLFTELRTPPGINLMNLSVSILLAQLLWLLESGRTDDPTGCITIAVLLHYFFLVSFVWTSIIAFDTWRAFQCSNVPIRLAVQTKRCARYMFVGWLSTIVYVVICVVLDSTDVITIYHNTSQACWMSNMLFFAVPVGCILLFNIVLYSLTLKAIKATTTQARAAVDHHNRRQLFGIYVRIASVMGFTWIVGSLLSIDSIIIEYVFIILNSCQGLYIALAFGLNQRARSLYKNRFSCLACVTLNSSTVSSSNSDAGQSEKRCEDSVETTL